jgi:hypothetical protein
MKIYTDNDYKIVALDIEPAHFEYLFEVDEDKSEMFGNWCDTCIRGYKYEPQFEMSFDNDGTHLRDEITGEFMYKLDKYNGKKISGFACYPYIDYHTLVLIQKQYEDSQKQVHVLNNQIEYLSMISNIEMDVSHE